MPDTFVKLYRSILTSSVWLEDPSTRLVWITMLASADADGIVWASVPGLGHAANLGLEETRRALDVLSSPDPESRTEEHEGRRIEKIDGGWKLLNHNRYREMRTRQQVLKAKRQARWREKSSG